jgi:WD40 repeat protein/tetratricopeptide (TPR) repeat protein
MSTEREAILIRLLRAIALSSGEFALLLARCNSREVRDRLIAELRSHLNAGLYVWDATPAMDVVNLVDILEDAPEGTQAACVTGLEGSPHLNNILAIANNAREEFRKRLAFPVVVWVTDEVEGKLRRRSPDLASWAAPPFVFALDRTVLQGILERETADVLEWAFLPEGKPGVEPELMGAWQECQRNEITLSPELEAQVLLAFGMELGSDEKAQEALERCLVLVETGDLAAAARYRLGLWWERRGKLNRAEFLECCDRARGYFQGAWEEDAGRHPNVGLALGGVLLALALMDGGVAEILHSPPKSPNSGGLLDGTSAGLVGGADLGELARWEAVAGFAEQLEMLPGFACGLRAEVALARRDFATARREAERALQTDDRDRTGLYLLGLGRSLIGLNQAQEAIAPLEEAKALVLPEVDPDLHIRVLRALHGAYTAAKDYRKAFAVKCDRAAVETQYGFRAFMGAGRLRPQRRVGALGEAATEEIAASGRQADIDALVERVRRNDCRLTVVHGPSGVGKSSLIQAGLVPALRKVIHQSRSVVPVVIEHYEDWQAELAQKLQAIFPERQIEASHFSLHSPPSPPILGGSDPQNSLRLGDFDPQSPPRLAESNPQSPPELGDLGGECNVFATPQLLTHLHENDRRNLITVLIFDQFEEFFFKHPDVPGRQQLYDFLRDCLDIPYVWVFLSLREDYVHYLLECDRLANLTLINNDILNKNVRYYLGNFSQERAKAVIRELTEKSPYRLEEGLIERWVADLAAELGEVRPIELQVVGAQMVQGEEKVLTLAAYEALGDRPKQALVERWLTEVVGDCGEENEELAQRVLFALTEEPEKRPVKTKTELAREVRLLGTELMPEEKAYAVQGDLGFVVSVPVGAGLAFEMPSKVEAGYQLIHDYLVPPIRRQFGEKLAQQLEEERQKRKVAEKERDKALKEKLVDAKSSNQHLRRVLTGTTVLAVGAVIAGGIATWQKQVADENALNSSAVVDSLIWKGLIDDNTFNLWSQVETIEKGKKWQAKLGNLHGDNRLELLATLQRGAIILKEKNRFEGHQFSVNSLAFSPDGRSILTGSEDSTAKLWSKDGRLLQTFTGHRVPLTRVAFSPNGQSILIEVWYDTVKLWSLDGRLLQTFTGHQSPVTSVAFAPDGQSILTGSADKTAKFWSLDGRLLQTFNGHQSFVSSVAFAPNGQSILTGSGDKTAKLWSLDGQLLQAFTGYQSPVTSVAFAPDGQSILTGSSRDDNMAKLWSLDGRLLQTFTGHQIGVTSVAFSPDGQSILTGSGDKTAKLWSKDVLLLKTFAGHRDSVTSVAYSPDGQGILTGSEDKTAKLWSNDGHLLKTFAGHQDLVSSVAFSPDGQSLLTGRGDNTAILWSRDGRLIERFAAQEADKSVAIAKDGQSILRGMKAHNTAKLFKDGRLLQTFNGHQSVVSSVAFSPDGQSLLTGSWDKTAKLWSRDGRLLQTFTGHQASVTSVAFAPDGQSILTGSADKTAKLWSRDGRLLQTFTGHQASVTSVAFAPDGQSILTGSADKTAKLWDLNLDHYLSATCSYLRDFAQGSSNPDLPEGSRQLRDRARRACEGVPPLS